jgi:hypothetical protein
MMAPFQAQRPSGSMSMAHNRLGSGSNEGNMHTTVFFVGGACPTKQPEPRGAAGQAPPYNVWSRAGDVWNHASILEASVAGSAYGSR